MEMKVLSIGIAAYNLGKYLPRCLDSLIIPSINDIEIIIVNNASTDNTPEIAQKYADKYCNSVRVVNIAVNGHYGRAVNHALAVATGKYFKLLDADDWYNSESLEKVVSKLKLLDADAVFTKFDMVYDSPERIEHQKGFELPIEKELFLKDVEIPRVYQEMHGLMYRTAFLKEIQYHQTEGVYYSDTEYVYYPLMKAKTFIALDISLYQYWIGREGQSISLKSRARQLSHFETLYDRKELRQSPPSFYGFCFKTRLLESIFFIGLLLSHSEEVDKRLHTYLKELRKVDYDVYTFLINMRIKNIRYVYIWEQKRLLSIVYFPIMRLIYKLKA